MKKTLLVLLIVLIAAGSLFSQSVTEDKEVKTIGLPEGGNFKLGVQIGYPSGITAGYRFSNWFEVNLTAGYNFLDYNSAIVSVNGLFTIVNIPIGDAGVMPLSLGPQLNMIIGNKFYLETVADLRLEYTFQNIPLNLYGDFGMGIRLFGTPAVDWAYNGGIGVRYVFN